MVMRLMVARNEANQKHLAHTAITEAERNHITRLHAQVLSDKLRVKTRGKILHGPYYR
jgi:hypothetical protein